MRKPLPLMDPKTWIKREYVILGSPEYEHFSIYDSLVTHQKYFVGKSVYVRLVKKKSRNRIYFLHGRISI